MTSSNKAPKPYVYFILLCVFFGCDFKKKSTSFPAELLIGSWLDDNKAKLHFTLFENGKASSENMKTLIYKRWTTRNDSLFLTVKSIGNRTRFESIEAYKIDTLDANNLVLHNKNFKMSYSRK